MLVGAVSQLLRLVVGTVLTLVWTLTRSWLIAVVVGVQVSEAAPALATARVENVFVDRQVSKKPVGGFFNH